MQSSPHPLLTAGSTAHHQQGSAKPTRIKVVIPATIEEWLDEFEMFSIYEVLPEILELWGMNLQTEIESKKNFIAVAGK